MTRSYRVASGARAGVGGRGPRPPVGGSSDEMDEVRRAIDAIRFSGDFPSATRVERVVTTAQIPRIELAETVRVEGRVPVGFLSWLEGLKKELGEHKQMLDLCFLKEV